MTITRDLATNIIYSSCQRSDAVLRKCTIKLARFNCGDFEDWKEFLALLHKLSDEQLVVLLEAI